MTKKVIVNIGCFLFWALLLAGTLVFAQIKPQPLTELERTKLELAQEKEKSNMKDALMIRQAYEQNQAKGKQLQDEEQQLLDTACTAHGIPPAHCQLSSDGLSVQEKTAPAIAKPLPKDKK